jgi:uncharacterized protein (DUF362 family)
MTTNPPALIHFESYKESVPKILDLIRADKLVKPSPLILLKPNLVNDSPFPVTTSPDFCKEVIFYLRRHTQARIIIAEGCGDSVLETTEVFQALGYDSLAKELGIELLDLNHAPLERLEHQDNRIFPHFFMPKITRKSFIISLPVLKAHSLAEITGTLKNMMGFAPPEHYSGDGFWKKAIFHNEIQTTIRELNHYVLPHLTLMDASVGLSQYHLGGPICAPPVDRLIAGTDPYMVDQSAARLLGIDPGTVPHIQSP